LSPETRTWTKLLTSLPQLQQLLDLRARTVRDRKVERGIVKVGEELEIVGLKPTLKTVCTGVEMFRKLLDEGRRGTTLGCCLRGTKREEVERGQVLSKPASITRTPSSSAEVYVLSKEEGGRHTPFFPGYRPQFYFRPPT